jgi:hypothetical protein
MSSPPFFWIAIAALFSWVDLSQAQDSATTLSASLQFTSGRPVLFPGATANPTLEIILHPNDRKLWDKVQVRLVASMDEQPVAKEAMPVTLATAGGKPLVADKWNYASYLGLNEGRTTVSLKVSHLKSTGKAPLHLHAEIEIPGIAAAATAPVTIRCADFIVTDIGDPAVATDDHIISDGDTAWLTEEAMPRLVASTPGLSADYKIQWRLESIYPRRGEQDHVIFPAEGRIELPGGQDWIAYATFHGRYFGGNAQISTRVLDSAGKVAFEATRKFRILCRNPPDAATVEFIKRRQGRFWYAWAIAQHESRQWKQVFNQFNEGGRVPNEPNFGAPDGWGVFQIDSARGAKVSTDEVWNWRSNAVAGFDELTTAETDTRNYFLAIQRSYPDTYEPPPPTYTPPGCKTTLTYEEASIIQCYNGAAVIRKLRNSFGSYSYYRSCWSFNPSGAAGKRWRYVENRNNYVFKVVKHEIEGELPVE